MVKWSEREADNLLSYEGIKGSYVTHLHVVRPPELKVRLPFFLLYVHQRRLYFMQYRGADKSLARPTSRCILFDCEHISFDASFVLCI
jgi:hypothetical protein